MLSANLTNSTAIGADARVDCSNCMVLGSINTVNGATSNVNIGIGTTNPAAQLHIGSSDLPNIPRGVIVMSRLWIDSTNSRASSIYHYVNSTTDRDQLVIGVAGDGGSFTSPTSYNNAKMVIQADGKIGIGTTTPAAPLHIGSSDLPNIPRGAIVMSRLWIDSTNSRASAIYHYVTTATDRDQLVFGVSGDGGSFTSPTLYRNAKMVIQANGNVGIGTVLPGAKLHVVGNILATGNVCANSTTCPSDIRFKKNITPLESTLKSLLLIRPIYYQLNSKDFPDRQFDEKRQIGFSAQEIENFFPEIVLTDASGFKSLDYSRMTPVLVEAVKEQQEQINSQTQKITAQNKKIEQQKEELQNIRTELAELKKVVQKLSAK